MRPLNPRHMFALLAGCCYAVMWLGYQRGWCWLDTADSAILAWTHHLGTTHPGWVRFWRELCVVFGPDAFRIVGAVVAIVALVRRRLRTALFVLVAIGLSGLLTRLAKGLADRPRPATMLVVEHDSAFPSGHSLAAMVGVCVLLAVLLPVLGPHLRVPAVVVGAVIVVAVGFGRVALNVHHPSDVLAGWSLGYLYYLVCLPLLATGPGRRQVADPASRSDGSLPVCP